jgi:hypothetical protein
MDKAWHFIKTENPKAKESLQSIVNKIKLGCLHKALSL